MSEDNTEYGLVVARVSEDFSVCLRSYVNVADETKKVFGKARWIGAENQPHAAKGRKNFRVPQHFEA